LEGAGVHHCGCHCSRARNWREHRRFQSRPHDVVRAARLFATHEVVQVFSQDRKNPKTFRGFSYPTYRDIREQNSVFTDVMAYNLAMVGLGQRGDTRRTFAGTVTANYFSVLGVPLAQAALSLRKKKLPVTRCLSRSLVTVTGKTFP
jgi:hypothetical protein